MSTAISETQPSTCLEISRLRDSFPVPTACKDSSIAAINHWVSSELIKAAQRCLSALKPRARMPTPEVRFDLRGLAAGKIHADRRHRKITLRFNLQLFDFPDDRYHELYDTITHEMAHAVLITSGLRERPHGDAWQAVALTLGCRGTRCHTLPLKRAKRHMEFLYQFDGCGDDYWLGPKIHRAIQERNRSYRIKLNNGDRREITPDNYRHESRRRE